MDSLSYFLLTEIKAKNVSMVEKIANFCLKPAQYLWNGKKIDLIQELDQKAVQIDFIYHSQEHSSIKTALMIALLIPGVILGSGFKAYATYRHHVEENDIFIKKCLKNKKFDKIFTPKGQAEFGKRICDYIAALKSTNSLRLKDPNKPLFLSEIEYIGLCTEENHSGGMFAGRIKDYDPTRADLNRKILDNIHFLWNLSYISLADHYSVSKPGIEASALNEINPYVDALQGDQLKRTQAIKAKVFFSNFYR